MSFRLKRVYDKPAKVDGRRALVDRVWPRCLTKEEAQIHDWLKEMPPSTRLRKWFGHDPARWTEFKERYAAELKISVNRLSNSHRRPGTGRSPCSLAAKDVEHNNVVALREFLETVA